MSALDAGRPRIITTGLGAIIRGPGAKQMINVSTNGSVEDQRAARRRRESGQRSAGVRAGRRLLGVSVRPDDRGKRRGRRPGVRVERRQAVRRSGQHQLSQGRRSRFRRHGHGRRFHDQEPERDVDLRLRFVVQRRWRRSAAIITKRASDTPVSVATLFPISAG